MWIPSWVVLIVVVFLMGHMVVQFLASFVPWVGRRIAWAWRIAEECLRMFILLVRGLLAVARIHVCDVDGCQGNHRSHV